MSLLTTLTRIVCKRSRIRSFSAPINSGVGALPVASRTNKPIISINISAPTIGPIPRSIRESRIKSNMPCCQRVSPPSIKVKALHHEAPSPSCLPNVFVEHFRQILVPLIVRGYFIPRVFIAEQSSPNGLALFETDPRQQNHLARTKGQQKKGYSSHDKTIPAMRPNKATCPVRSSHKRVLRSLGCSLREECISFLDQNSDMSPPFIC